jgi:hypothetical protein
MRKTESLIGKKFNRLTVVEEIRDKNNKLKLKCRCDCGGETITTSDKLKSGHTKSCGCLKRERSLENLAKKPNNTVDRTGIRYGRLIALKNTQKKSGSNFIWECKCDCGNIVEVSGQSLERGLTQSCGCLQKEKSKLNGLNSADNLIGMKYGKLTVIEKTDQRQGKNIIWKCLCECGTYTYVSGGRLKSGNTKSCGLCGLNSVGEHKISELLKQNNIDFLHDVNFRECRYPDGGLARFDFVINDSFCIEYDGIQHFDPSVKGNWGDEEYFNTIQEHDAYKNKWCQLNNIPLIRIPYTHLHDLSYKDLTIEFSSFLVN